MKIAIRYYTRTGHTAKLAGAIAEATGAEALTLSAPLEEKVDVLFLGCSYYAFDMDEAVKAYIAANRENIGEIVCFGTSAMMRSMKKPMAKVAESCGVALSDKEFHCRGEFKFANKGRPNAEDLAEVRQFAKSVIAHG